MTDSDKKLERYVALVPLLRFHQPIAVGQWVRLEPETGAILGLHQAVPESALKADPVDPSVLRGMVESRACFADGALQYARRVLGLSTADCIRLAHEHAEEFVKRHGSALALVQGIGEAELKKWAKK